MQSLQAACGADVPGNYASLVPSDAYAVGWIDSVESILDSAKTLAPQGVELPSNLTELMSGMAGIEGLDNGIRVGDSIIAWVARGADMGGGMVGDPQLFVAFKARGANADNTPSTSETTFHFVGDMLVAAQGGDVEYTKPQGARSPLIRALPNDAAAVAADIEGIWADHGPQLQMMGGFGAMAAQMALMEQTQEAAPEDRARIRSAQRKVGEVTRRLLNGVFEHLKTMDVLTLGIDLSDEGMFALTTDFIYQENLASRGVNPALVRRLPGGQATYFAANAAMIKWAAALDLGLAEVVFSGLSKEQHAALDAFAPMVVDLTGSITGGFAAAVNPDPMAYTEYVELEVQDARAFINDSGLLMEQLNNLGLGMSAEEVESGEWEFGIDGEELGHALERDEAGELAAMAPANMRAKLQDKGRFVTAFITAGKGPHGINNDMATRDALLASRGRSLIMGCP